MADCLYKFRCWDNDHPYDKRILTHNELWFASAEDFNDPFDCTIPPRYDLLNPEQVKSLIKRHVDEQNPNLSRKKRRELVKYWFDKKLYQDEDNVERALNQNLLAKYKFGIFSLAGIKNNLLLWSHYSNAHTGFCICLDKAKLDNCRYNAFSMFELVIDAFDIEYVREYPILLPTALNENDIIIKQVTIKSIDWEYEKEHRLICLNKTRFPLEPSDDIFAEIILGCKMTNGHKNEIINVLKDKSFKIPLYQANMNKDSFGLNFEPIDY